MSDPLVLLTDVQTAKMLGVCPRTVFTLADGGKLKRVKIGRSVRYDPKDIAAFVEHSKTAKAPRKGAVV